MIEPPLTDRGGTGGHPTDRVGAQRGRTQHGSYACRERPGVRPEAPHLQTQDERASYTFVAKSCPYLTRERPRKTKFLEEYVARRTQRRAERAAPTANDREESIE